MTQFGGVMTFKARVKACAFGLVLGGLVWAQSERGTILGTVKDPTGAVIVNAKITVTNTATNVSSILASNNAGDYTAPSLPPGSYNLRFEKEGFRPAVIAGMVVSAAATVRADVTL